jgi:aryl-alcohol dehydrogenase-like predicted oxidoreductase
MQSRNIPGIAQELSVIGLGTWNISGQWGEVSEDTAIELIHAAIDNGINLIDTAPIYGMGNSDILVGKALKDRRDKVVLAGKCGLVWNNKGAVRNDLSKSTLLQEIDRNLERLQTDYIDIYQIHWPNPEYPLEETVETLERIKKQGKILNWGVCNFSKQDLETILELGSPKSFQGLYNMLEQDAQRYHSMDLEYRTKSEIIPIVEQQHLAFFPYSPLMQGMLTGKIQKTTEFDENDVRKSNDNFKGERFDSILNLLSELKPIAEEAGTNLLGLSMAWLTKQKAVSSVISGARNRTQVESNAALGDLKLDDSSWDAVENLLREFGV